MMKEEDDDENRGGQSFMYSPVNSISALLRLICNEDRWTFMCRLGRLIHLLPLEFAHKRPF